MYMLEYDLRDLELQLHGFDAGLGAAGALDPYSRFNWEFTQFVMETTGLSGSLGWATALVDAHGKGKPAFDAFCELLLAALPADFDPAAFAQ
jgi:hypothetical protein